MLRAKIFPLLLFLIFSFTDCGNSTDAARLQLAQMNVPYIEQHQPQRFSVEVGHRLLPALCARQ